MRFLGGGGQVQDQQYEDEGAGPVPQASMFGMPPRFNEDTKWQYELHDVLQMLENFLRGRVMNPETGKYRKAYEPMMTEEGINLMMTDLAAHLHKGIFLSNISKEDVNRKMLALNEMLANWIYLKWDVYKIERSNMDRIMEIMDTNAFMALMKPVNDLERVHRGQMTTINENRQFIQEGRRKKVLGIF